MEPFERALNVLEDFYNESSERHEFSYMDVFALYPHIIEYLRNQTGKQLRYELTIEKWVIE